MDCAYVGLCTGPQKHIKLLHATSECLVVRLQIGNAAPVILVAHAPPSAQVDKYRCFWDQLPSLIPSQCRDMQWLGLSDANARLGSLSSPCVGTHAPEEETEAAAYFHEFLQTQRLLLPATFEHWRRGSSSSWTHSSGSVARLDYVAVPSAWAENRHPLSTAPSSSGGSASVPNFL